MINTTNNEQSILLWSVTDQKWIPTYIFFVENGTPIVAAATGNLLPQPIVGYQELLPKNSIFPTSYIWYADSTKRQKIVAVEITWHKTVPTKIVYQIYSADGSTIIQQMQEVITYTNNIFVSNVTRSLI
jgi:hypothetical protein